MLAEVSMRAAARPARGSTAARSETGSVLHVERGPERGRPSGCTSADGTHARGRRRGARARPRCRAAAARPGRRPSSAAAAGAGRAPGRPVRPGRDRRPTAAWSTASTCGTTAARRRTSTPTPMLGRGYKVGVDRPDPRPRRRPTTTARPTRPPRPRRRRAGASATSPACGRSPLDAQVCCWTESPDGRFVIDTLPGGVVVACGDTGRGLQVQRPDGLLLADLAEGRAPDAEVASLSLARFAPAQISSGESGESGASRGSRAAPAPRGRPPARGSAPPGRASGRRAATPRTPRPGRGRARRGRRDPRSAGPRAGPRCW